MRSLYAKRAEMLSKALSDADLHISDGLDIQTKNIHTCIEVNQKYSVKELERSAIKVADIDDYYYKKSLAEHYYLPINVSNVEEGHINAGIKKLILTIKKP